MDINSKYEMNIAVAICSGCRPSVIKNLQESVILDKHQYVCNIGSTTRAEHYCIPQIYGGLTMKFNSLYCKLTNDSRRHLLRQLNNIN